MSRARLADELLRAGRVGGDRLAISMPGGAVTFRDQLACARRVADHAAGAGAKSVGVLGGHAGVTHAAMLGLFISGASYVPVSDATPPRRVAAMLDAAGADDLLLHGSMCDRVDALAGWRVRGRVAGTSDLFYAARVKAPRAVSTGLADGVEPSTAPCYTMFTSGSTGEPKGVPVTHENLDALLRWSLDHYAPTRHDRWVQTFDPSFDLSLFAPLVAWLTGGCVFHSTPRDVFGLCAFVRRHAITVWFSVPTTAMLMARAGLDAMPSLRWSLFCGEPLTTNIAEAWHSAASTSTVENLYGPTEATLFCTYERFRPGAVRSGAGSSVPIGRPLPGHHAVLLGEDGRPTGTRGVLAVSGPQVFGGYLGPRVGRAPFVRIEGRTYYVTGDLVEREVGGRMRFLGRIDRQVKVQGYRVELAEIEEVLRGVRGVLWAHVMVGDEGRELQAIVVGDLSSHDVLAGARERLPEYMIPRRVRFLDRIPTTTSGKLDTVFARDAAMP